MDPPNIISNVHSKLTNPDNVFDILDIDRLGYAVEFHVFPIQVDWHKLYHLKQKVKQTAEMYKNVNKLQ